MKMFLERFELWVGTPLIFIIPISLVTAAEREIERERVKERNTPLRETLIKVSVIIFSSHQNIRAQRSKN